MEAYDRGLVDEKVARSIDKPLKKNRKLMMRQSTFEADRIIHKKKHEDVDVDNHTKCKSKGIKSKFSKFLRRRTEHTSN